MISKPDIQPASQHARRRAVAVVGIALVMGSAVIIMLNRYGPAIDRYAIEHADELIANAWIVAMACAVLLLPLILLAFSLFRTAARVVREERFPPAGMEVVRDTPIATGRAATVRARVLQVAAVVTVAAALGIPLALWLFLRSLDAVSG